MTLCHFAAALKAGKPAEDKGSVSKFLCTTPLSRGGDWNSLRRSICKQLLKEMSGLQHRDQNGKGNCSKTFRRLVFPLLNFSTTTETSRFQWTNLSIPAKGEENNLHFLIWWCDTNSGWKELVLFYRWTVTTLHGDPLLEPTITPCFLSGGSPRRYWPSWESQPRTRTTP